MQNYFIVQSAISDNIIIIINIFSHNVIIYSENVLEIPLLIPFTGPISSPTSPPMIAAGYF